MPSRKQRRRREKSHRHEWEYVEVDPETGEERTVAPAELKAEKPEKPKRETAKPSSKGGKPRSSSRMKEPEPASWQKVFKRTAFFAPLIAIFMYWTTKNTKDGASWAKILINTAILIAVFVPFSYFVDTMTYRFYSKRRGGKSS
jgi:hypothetical protein